MIAIPIAATAAPLIANSKSSPHSDKRLSEETCGKSIAFPHRDALSCFIQCRFRGKRLMEECSENQDRMALSNVMFRRQKASISEGMQLIVFASVPAIASFLICLAISTTR